MPVIPILWVLPTAETLSAHVCSRAKLALPIYICSPQARWTCCGNDLALSVLASNPLLPAKMPLPPLYNVLVRRSTAAIEKRAKT